MTIELTVARKHGDTTTKDPDIIWGDEGPTSRRSARRDRVRIVRQIRLR